VPVWHDGNKRSITNFGAGGIMASGRPKRKFVDNVKMSNRK
jgi:hypothetical protein